MSARKVVFLLAVGIGSAILGYGLANVLFAKDLIDLFLGNGAFERNVVSGWSSFVCCAGPLIVTLGSCIVVMVVFLCRMVRISTPLQYALVAVLSAVVAFVSYFPLQVLELIAYAF